jgi:hypothetical protein
LSLKYQHNYQLSHILLSVSFPFFTNNLHYFYINLFIFIFLRILNFVLTCFTSLSVWWH